MSQITKTPPAIPDPTKDAWGAAMNALLAQIITQGNASDTAISNLTETIQDTVAAMFRGSGITFTYDDAAGTLTATVGGSSGGGSGSTTSYLLTDSGAYLTSDAGDRLVAA